MQEINKQYVSKLLKCIKDDKCIFSEKEINFIVGLTSTQIKECKTFAFDNKLIEEKNKEYFLTHLGDNFIIDNPIKSSNCEEYPLRFEVNLEYLKLEKAPSILTRAIRNLARHLLEDEPIKELSIEYFLIKELLCENSKAKNVKKEIEDFILSGDKIKIDKLYEKYENKPYGLTKSIISILLLDILSKNRDKIAIYEDFKFKLKLNQLLFDRIIYCAQKYEIQKTEMDDFEVLEKISQFILPDKSKNILELTKGLIGFIKNLERYTLNTNTLSKQTIKFRNAIINAKDPMTLWYRDLPKILDDKILCQCDDNFVYAFENALNELKDCYTNLVDELIEFFIKSFGYSVLDDNTRNDLAQRFQNVCEYFNLDDLKILKNNVVNLDSKMSLWIERIATFINTSRVPKDFSDNDVANFKLKVKDYAFKFKTIEATIGVQNIKLSERIIKVLKQVLKLDEAERLILLKEVLK